MSKAYALHLTIMPKFKPGDPPPSGYLEWHEWARVQHKAGYRQRRCADCGKLHFSQEHCTQRRDASDAGTQPNTNVGGRR